MTGIWAMRSCVKVLRHSWKWRLFDIAGDEEGVQRLGSGQGGARALEDGGDVASAQGAALAAGFLPEV
ncbi:hypothetical protein ACF1E9_14740 [Streptomyces roseolus]|uniref:hypothetical protein n=1 Tax=Streptomyces roseolus TaxID=67358 RepID=UPI0036E92D59